MNLEITYPSGRVDSLINYYRIREAGDPEGTAGSSAGIGFLDYPKGYNDLLLCRKGAVRLVLLSGKEMTLRGNHLVGSFSNCYAVSFEEGTECLNIRLTMTGASRLFRESMFDFHNGEVRLDCLDRTLGDRIGSILENEKPLSACLPEIETLLWTHVQNRGSKDPMAEDLIRTSIGCRGRLRVESLSRRHGLGYKQLERMFKRRVGLPPKQFLRIQRLSGIMGEIASDSDPDWMRIVADYGYFDQSHFVRDFKEFTGSTPSGYLEMRDRFL